MEQRRFGSLVAGIDVLEKLAATPEGASVTDLAGALALDKGYLHRLLRTLGQRGYVEQDPTSKTFRATVKLVALASVILRNLDVLSAAPPVMRRLLESSGETVHLARRVAGGGVYVAQARPSARISVDTEIGSQPQLHCTATGKALLAFSGPGELRSLLKEPLARFTPRTLSSLAELESDLAAARERGYALDDGEGSEDLRCVAAPIFDMTGKVMACLGMSGPINRLSLERLSELGLEVAAAAAEISRMIGGRLPVQTEREDDRGRSPSLAEVSI
jgi:IclR family acetate operon transcriptional repressor